MEAAYPPAFAPVTPDVRLDIYRGEEWVTAFAAEVREGLSRRQRELSPKYFYDARGSELFDRITLLPEYYLTRTETAILEARGPAIVERSDAGALFELGSGSSVKTELLLAPLIERSKAPLYVPVDVSESAVRAAAVRLVDSYPGLRVHAMICDFEKHLGGLPPAQGRLIAFLGGTIGNFTPERMRFFLRRVRGLMDAGDHMLIGVDMVKDVAELEAAYNDTQGVTAEFNKNVLAAINANLAGDFDLDAFDHVAFFDDENAWIEMRLRATHRQRVRVGAIDLELTFEVGDEIRTEISRKFTRARFEREIAATGLAPVDWYTDDRERFALVLVRPV